MKIDDREFYFVTGLCTGALTVFVLFTLLLPASAYEYEFFELPYTDKYVDDAWTQKWTYCWNCPPPQIIIVDDDKKTHDKPPKPDKPGKPDDKGKPDDTPGNGPPDKPPKPCKGKKC